MSLKIFHMVFIVASVLLSLTVAGWSVREYMQNREFSWLLFGLLFVGVGAGLVVYGMKAWPKYRELR